MGYRTIFMPWRLLSMAFFMSWRMFCRIDNHGAVALKSAGLYKTPGHFSRRVTGLKYINAKTILPESLLKELQRYIQGEILYVPGCEARAGWGEANGTRHKYALRNKEYRALCEGCSIDEIAGKLLSVGYTSERSSPPTESNDQFLWRTSSIRPLDEKRNYTADGSLTEMVSDS
jgi:hypothetical protein